jgi:hypothetical protein
MRIVFTHSHSSLYPFFGAYFKTKNLPTVSCGEQAGGFQLKMDASVPIISAIFAGKIK